MFLFEFDNGGAETAKIVALTNQLQQDLEDGDIPDDFTVDELLDYFQKYDVILDVNDLYDMIKEPPLDDLIKNIKGDKVIFKGQDEDTGEAPKNPDEETKNKKIVSKMANSALSNLKSAGK